MVRDIHEFFIHLLGPGKIDDFCAGSVDLEDVRCGDLHRYEGVKYPSGAPVLSASQIVKFSGVETPCEVTLLSIDDKSYLETVFMQPGYSSEAPFLSFLFENGGGVHCKYSTPFETFHDKPEAMGKAPVVLSSSQKGCYRFITGEIDKYNRAGVVSHGV